MDKPTGTKVLIILAHAFVAWALCGAVMGIGLAATTEQNAIIAHAIAAPIIAFGVSLFYFTRFNYTTPLLTAAVFVGFIIVVDFFLVALVINKSLDMFTSPLGTWIPFALIFTSTVLTGRWVTRRAVATARTA